jgi:folate-dependent phosphoribosylglycinamide formyltransferase PurN
MEIKLLYDDYKKNRIPMKVAGFMSGSGTNLRRIIEHQKNLGKNTPYELIFLFSNVSDPKKCKIREISEEYGLEYKINDLKEFYEEKQADRRNLQVRKEYDKTTAKWLKDRKIDAVVLGGYMAIVTEEIYDNFITINVHPADLSILDGSGRRKFVGDSAVKDAIIAGEEKLRSSVHIATKKVDGGPLLLISKSINVNFPPEITLADLRKPENESLLIEIADTHQDKLKEKGDWVIFPLALEYIARGYIGYDAQGNIYYKEKPIPDGLRL